MAKKRKAGGGASGAPKAPKEEDSRMAINTWEDVADSEDDFHMNRDKILLDEGPAAKRMRKYREEDQFLEASDEEILDIGSDDESEADFDDDEDEKPKPVEEEDVDLGGWGASKKDYYDADAIETEQDALDEEAEARRIQKKQLQGMTEADFGFDEDEWLGQDEEKDVQGGAVVTEVLPQLHITESMSEEEKMKIMRARYPEFEHISKEYLRLQPLHDELAATANAAEKLLKAQAAKSGRTIPTPMAVTKYRACAAYLAAMAMYFAVLGSTANEHDSSVIALDPVELHEHPVMESLLQCQKMWSRVESLPVSDPMVEAEIDDDVSEIDQVNPELHRDALAVKKPIRQRKTKAERAAEIAQAEAAARRTAKLAKTEQDLATLDALTDKAALKKAARKKKVVEPKLNLLNADDSDFGEETELTAHEAAEKAKKKKSLRFYTSQITQKSNKRDTAGKDQGGDADIPRRERLKERQARLQAEAEKRGQQNAGPGVALGDDDGASSGEEAPIPKRSDFEDEEGYYDMIAARFDKKKQTKLDRAEAYALAKQQGVQVFEEETIDDDGRRQISYQIQKNKGLTPHRKKSVRNPRVKKKEKYKEKQKKLKSMKQVFDKGAAAKGSASYGGELTGIKSGLVRSRKL
ncbi:Sas10/Utp3 family protein [Pyrenophora tritici-repentis Pt-1C-BFP]|uniref:Sas10/Utp3 family protein n=1 Tax=Pyrenophora tritici-repentis (strain Pt-1C-BFP) TaxID=426418 RepID=B2VSV1_PYRTR|nr:Sas10/Utp3 family protein [Pyrenophora tritici-repentis Pt-1C-BFP]EDU40173.1 Sas10/Utp3 family protein [Pyrenophora tritici-repentis Pt-1C-BFP]